MTSLVEIEVEVLFTGKFGNLMYKFYTDGSLSLYKNVYHAGKQETISLTPEELGWLIDRLTEQVEEANREWGLKVS